MGEAKI